ncbi:MAG: hypothetical protein WB588_00720 [Dehalococcoidia bacterium]
MPVERRWYEFTREKVLDVDRGMAGIYWIGDIDKKPVYIGSSDKSVRGRLLAHIRNKRCPKGKLFRYIELDEYADTKQVEAGAVWRHVRKYRKLPLYIKSYPYFKTHGYDWPF